MSDDNPNVIPEMDPSLRRQLQQVNWQVCNVTTPANYFHVLRRQVRAKFSYLFPFLLFPVSIFRFSLGGEQRVSGFGLRMMLLVSRMREAQFGINQRVCCMIRLTLE